MWYFILYAVLAVWVFVDAKKRQNNTIGWSASTVFLGPVILPVYIARRNLVAGEVREGGTGWNVLKNFALFWTITMLIAGIMMLISGGQVVGESTDTATQAGAALGATLGLGFIFMLWITGAVSALVIGAFIKKSSVIEKGPTIAHAA